MTPKQHMTEKEKEYILYGNYLIGRFLGKHLITKLEFNPCLHQKTDEDGKSLYEILDYTRYHYEWNWLMPVVEKIETIEYPLPEKYRRGFFKNSTHANITIDTIYDSREEFKGWSSRVGFEGGNQIFDSTAKGENVVRYETKIESIYIGVVSFIEWYNENKQ